MTLQKKTDFVIPSPKLSDNTICFTNPIGPDRDSADPTVRYDPRTDAWYAISTGNTTLTLCKARRFERLFQEENKIIYEARDEDGTYGYLWAPELHFVDGHWYIYTSTHEKNDTGHKHLIVLKAKTDDPMDGFELAAHLPVGTVAIDPTVCRLKRDGRLYICYSIVDPQDHQQKLCIREMASPTSFMNDKTAMISAVTYPAWEQLPSKVNPYGINEGAYFIQEGERVFIVYSANGCWNDDYVLGILELVGEDPVSAASWVKDEVPFFTKGNGVVGPGHATFFASPDGEQYWIAYHALHASNPAQQGMARHLHCQQVFFDETGFPHIGQPVAPDYPYPVPSGQKSAFFS